MQSIKPCSYGKSLVPLSRPNLMLHYFALKDNRPPYMWYHIQDPVRQIKPQLTSILSCCLNFWVKICDHSNLSKFFPFPEIVRIHPKCVLVPQVEFRLLQSIIYRQLYFLPVKTVTF